MAQKKFCLFRLFASRKGTHLTDTHVDHHRSIFMGIVNLCNSYAQTPPDKLPDWHIPNTPWTPITDRLKRVTDHTYFKDRYGERIAQSVAKSGNVHILKDWLAYTNNPNQMVQGPDPHSRRLIDMPMFFYFVLQGNVFCAQALVGHPAFDHGSLPPQPAP